MEILGILEKVFYEGNEKLPGGKYTLTVVNIETGERIELKVKLNAKEDFVVGVIYRIEYYDDEVRNFILMYENMNDFVNKIVSHRNYNYIRNQNQAKVQFVKYCIFAIIVIFICYIIRSFI